MPRSAIMITRSRRLRLIKTRVPPDAQDDDLPVEVPSFEYTLDRAEPVHYSSSLACGRVCTRADWETPCTSDRKKKPGISPETVSSLRTDGWEPPSVDAACQQRGRRVNRHENHR